MVSQGQWEELEGFYVERQRDCTYFSSVKNRLEGSRDPEQTEIMLLPGQAMNVDWVWRRRLEGSN